MASDSNSTILISNGVSIGANAYYSNNKYKYKKNNDSSPSSEIELEFFSFSYPLFLWGGKLAQVDGDKIDENIERGGVGPPRLSVQYASQQQIQGTKFKNRWWCFKEQQGSISKIEDQ